MRTTILSTSLGWAALALTIFVLPSAAAIPYRVIRFVNDSTVVAADKVHIVAPAGETIDGGAFYEINKPYNGCMVWSDGTEWIVIQAKST